MSVTPYMIEFIKDYPFYCMKNIMGVLAIQNLWNMVEKDEINEIAGVVGIIGYILLSNTLANMLSKIAKRLSVKYQWGTGEAAAKKIYDFTHKNEEAFKAPIKRVVGLLPNQFNYQVL